MSKKFRFVDGFLFDLDDTLYEEKQYVFSGFRRVATFLAKKHDRNSLELFDYLKKTFQEGLRNKNFDQLLNEFEIDEKVERLVKVYREHNPSIGLFSDAEKALKELKEESLILLTGGPVVSQKKKVSALELDSYFDEIIFTQESDESQTKLNSEVYLDLLERNSLDPMSVVCVGDNPIKDFLVPNYLGMVTVRVQREKGKYSDLKMKNTGVADFTITDLGELFDIFEKCDC